MPDKDATSAAVPQTDRSAAAVAVAEPLVDGGGAGSNCDPSGPRSVVADPFPNAPPRGTAPSGSYSSQPPASPAEAARRASEAPPLEGTLIGGKYRLVRCLSEGGMGTVWAAHHEALDAEVAVKVLRAGLRAPDSAERFHREAQAAAKLGHPAIVRVLDFGHSDTGEPYIVMERLHGEDLRTRLGRSLRLPPVAAVRLLLPVAHAIAAAHDKGIVHRDIKPENIFLSVSEGTGIQPKLVDFGIATMTSHFSSSLTLDSVVGSPGYMSPEQARGEEVDHRTDIWSFCIVLYESLIGGPPFVATNYNKVLREVIETDPAPLVSFLPKEEELSALLERGLAKDRRQRWPSMRVLGIELAQWLLARGISDDATNTSLQSTWMPMRRASEVPHAYVRTVHLSLPPSASSGSASEAPVKSGVSASLAAAVDSEAPISAPAHRRSGYGRTSVVLGSLGGAAAIALAVAGALGAFRTDGAPVPAGVPSPKAQANASPAAPGPARQLTDSPAMEKPSTREGASTSSTSLATTERSTGSGDASALATARQKGHALERSRAVQSRPAAGSSLAARSPKLPTQALPRGPATDTATVTDTDTDTVTDIKTTF